MPEATDAWRVGSLFDVHFVGAGDEISGDTISKVQSSGATDRFELTGPDGLRLTLAHVRWRTAEREIRVLARYQSPERFDSLKNRRRLGVDPSTPSERTVALKPVRYKGAPGTSHGNDLLNLTHLLSES